MQIALSFAALAFALSCVDENADPASDWRTIASEKWDTVFSVGAETAEDTTFAVPLVLKPWNDGVLVGDDVLQQVVYLGSDGAVRWRQGGPGRGPGEYLFLTDFVDAPTGNVWVVDARAGRFTELDARGTAIRNVAIGQGPRLPGDYEYDGRHIIGFSSHPAHGLLYYDSTMQFVESRQTPWPDTIPSTLRTTLVAAADARRSLVVAAFHIGPGFFVMEGDSVVAHQYMRPVTFEARPTANVPMGNTEYAARSVAIVDDEIHFLFGGQPRRAAQDEVETVYVDIYGLNGQYRRSLRLPFGVDAMATDGDVYYVSRTDPYPGVFSLRPE